MVGALSVSGKFPYLVLDANRWWYLRRPPKDVLHAFPPRIKRALGTGDQKTAEGRWNAVHQEVEAQIERIREEIRAAEQPVSYTDLSEAEVRALITRAWWCWLHLRKAETNSVDDFPDFAMAVLAKLPANVHLWNVTRLRTWYADLDRHKLTAIFAPLAEAALRREIPALISELHGVPMINVGNTKFFTRERDKPLMLKELIERFELDANRLELAATTKGNHRPAFNALLGILGPEANISTINRADILKVREALLWLPAYYDKSKDLAGLPLTEIVARTKAKRDAARQKLDELGIVDPTDADIQSVGMPPFLKRTAINKYLGGISQLFDWAVGEQLIQFSPATKLRLKKVPDSDRRSLNAEELLQLFHRDYPFDAVSWILVILLYQGLRPNEACQLHTEDVIQHQRSRVWCLRIAVEPRADRRLSDKAPDRTLKNTHSRRLIPIHQRLVDLGFLEYLERRRAAGERMLFNVKKTTEKSRYYDSVRDHLRKMMEDAGIYSRVTPVHSLRHTFAEALRNLAGAPQDIREAIGGWASSGSAEIDYGSERFWPENMKVWLDRIDWPRLFHESAPTHLSGD